MLSTAKRIIVFLFPSLVKMWVARKIFIAHGVSYDGVWWKSRLLRDALRMRDAYGFEYVEYLGFRMREKSEIERCNFISNFEHEVFSIAANREIDRLVLDDKFRTYELFRPYYGREIINICGKSDAERKRYEAFSLKHRKFMIKPHNGAIGIGCLLIEEKQRGVPDFDAVCAMIDESRKSFCNFVGYHEFDGFICEEYIEADKRISAFHPASLNTFRIVTIKDCDDNVAVKYACFRMGRGGATVDNAGAGGILCSVDIVTGVCSAAVDEFGNEFRVHPDTGWVIEGFEIPRWNEAIMLVSKLAKVIDGMRYGAWDLALTSEGWIMVEANFDGQFIWQYPMKRGFREELCSWVRAVGIKEDFSRPRPVDWDGLRRMSVTSDGK